MRREPVGTVAVIRLVRTRQGGWFGPDVVEDVVAAYCASTLRHVGAHAPGLSADQWAVLVEANEDCAAR